MKEDKPYNKIEKRVNLWDCCQDDSKIFYIHELNGLELRKGHYIMIKGSIQQEDTTFVNIYAPNIGAPKYIKQKLIYLRGEKEIQ